MCDDMVMNNSGNNTHCREVIFQMKCFHCNALSRCQIVNYIVSWQTLNYKMLRIPVVLNEQIVVIAVKIEESNRSRVWKGYYRGEEILRILNRCSLQTCLKADFSEETLGAWWQGLQM